MLASKPISTVVFVILFLTGTATTPGIATAQEEGAIVLEEIIVTARKREESLQSVPLAVSVLTGKSLEQRGALKLDIIGKIAPNVHFESAQPTSGVKAPIVFIRGMGQDDFLIVEDPAVGVYLDGVYLGRTIGSSLDLVEVERIEVMRGPQGTLFGRNTIGGAINVISKKPGDTFHGTGKFIIGEDNHYEGRLAVNVPMGDNFGGRFSGFFRKRDGYIKALQYDGLELGNDDVWGIRGAIAGNLTDDISIGLALDYTQSRETPGAASPINGRLGVLGGTLNSGPRNPGTFGNFWNARFSGNAASCTTAAGQASNPACYGSVYSTNDPYAVNSVFADSNGAQITPEQKVDVWGGNLTVEWELGAFTAKSITAYREFDVSLFNDLDFSPHISFHNNHPEFSQEQVSQEFQLLGKAFSDRLTYVLGAYYFQESGVEEIFNQIAHPISSGPPAFFFQTIRRFVNNDSLAGFGQFTFDISDSLHLTAGARYTRSDKSFDLETVRRRATTLQQGSLSQTEFTPMITLSWDIADEVMTYFTYSQGFRDGGYPARFTGVVPNPLPNYEPEFVTNYEIGLKSTFADNRVRLNASVFYMDYEDMQITATTLLSGVGDNTTKFNLGSASIAGAEAELSAVLTERLIIGANIGYLDDNIDELVGGFLVSSGVRIEKDHDLPYTPDWTLSLSSQYKVPLQSGASVVMLANWAFKDDYYNRLENFVETLETNHQSLDLSANYTSANGIWEIGIGARNVTNEVYYQSRRIFSAFGMAFGQPVRPRTVYGTFQYNFGAQ